MRQHPGKGYQPCVSPTDHKEMANPPQGGSGVMRAPPKKVIVEHSLAPPRFHDVQAAARAGYEVCREYIAQHGEHGEVDKWKPWRDVDGSVRAHLINVAMAMIKEETEPMNLGALNRELFRAAVVAVMAVG